MIKRSSPGMMERGKDAERAILGAEDGRSDGRALVGCEGKVGGRSGGHSITAAPGCDS